MNVSILAIILTFAPFIILPLVSFMIHAYREDLTISAPVVSLASIRIACHVYRFKAATYAVKTAVLTIRTLNAVKRSYARTLRRLDTIEGTIGRIEDNVLTTASAYDNRARLTVHNVLTGVLLGIDTARVNVRIACHVYRFKAATYAVKTAVLTIRTLNAVKRSYARTLASLDTIEHTIGRMEDTALVTASAYSNRARLTVHNVLTGVLLGIDTARDNVKISRN